ncbi:MAG: hypothetical protein WC343_10060 [Bacilli bacterium]|jgi:hypothetical protein
MTLTEEQRAAIKIAIRYIPHWPTACKELHARGVLQAMIDSSDHIVEIDELIGFDLEKNRAAIDSAINSLLCEGWDNEASTVRRLVAEIERLRAENLELQWEVFGPDGIRANQACIIADQAASISELEIEIIELKADLEQSERVIEARSEVINQQAARIKDLEDALVEERARWCSRENTGAQLSQAGDQFQKRCRRSARLQLQAEGKIGPDAEAAHCECQECSEEFCDDDECPRPRSWQITEERAEALEDAVNRYDTYDRCLETYTRKMRRKGLLKAMLEEAGQ